MPDPADYPHDDNAEEAWEEDTWDAVSACLGMVGVYMLASCLVVLIVVLVLQLFRYE